MSDGLSEVEENASSVADIAENCLSLADIQVRLTSVRLGFQRDTLAGEQDRRICPNPIDLIESTNFETVRGIRFEGVDCRVAAVEPPGMDLESSMRLTQRKAPALKRFGVFDSRALAAWMQPSSLQGWIYGVPRVEYTEPIRIKFMTVGLSVPTRDFH